MSGDSKVNGARGRPSGRETRISSTEERGILNPLKNLKKANMSVERGVVQDLVGEECMYLSSLSAFLSIPILTLASASTVPNYTENWSQLLAPPVFLLLAPLLITKETIVVDSFCQSGI